MENNEAGIMGQGLFTIILMVWLLTGCSTTTPAEYSDAAYNVCANRWMGTRCSVTAT